jgi:hypothetical protein
MTDFLYKFPDETTAQNVLSSYYDAELGWQTGNIGFALDPVGILVDNNIPLDGWHINLRVLDDRSNPAAEYTVTPVNQRRVWL